MTDTIRWINLSAYDLKLKRVILPTGREIVAIKDVDQYATQMELMGLKRLPSGVWMTENMTQNPRDWRKHFPEATFGLMPVSEVFEDRRGTSAPDQIADVVPAEEKDTVIGLNRTGQMVYQDKEGVRYIKQAYNKRLLETETQFNSAQQFLRAETLQQLGGCTDGFLRTIDAHPDAEYANFEVFRAVTGAWSSEEFAAALLESINRKLLNDRDIVSLAARYNKAHEIREGLSKRTDIPAIEEHDMVILARRLLGMDKDLLGNSVYANVANQVLLRKLLPERGVAIAENHKEASFVIDFASSSKAAAQTILERVDATTTVSVIPVGTPATAKKIVDQISKIARIENAAFVGAEAGGPKLIINSVASPAPDQTFEMIEINNVGDLWSWASVVTTTRAHAIEMFKSGLSTDADLTAAGAYITQNAQQVPYASASKVGKPTLLSPKDIKEATNQALDRLLSTHTDVDALVAREYGFEKKDLAKYFSPEQIDALGLTVVATDRGRAMLNADGPGCGKGRWNLANVRRELRKGRKCLLLTEAAINFSDLLRDAKHLGMLEGKDKLRVAILNKNAKVIDEATGLPFDVIDSAVLEEAISNGEWPQDVDLVIGSYSQFNSGDEAHLRGAWMKSIVAENAPYEIAFLGDEIHNAATLTSNTSANITALIDAAAAVYMSSATHAHTTAMVAFYSRLLPDGIDTDELRSMMVRGGDTFQEVLTSMLVADGVMVRRERNVMDLEFRQSVALDNIDKNKGLMDQLAVIVFEMAKLSGRLDDMVEEFNHRGDNVAEGVEMKKMGLGGPLHLMARLFDAAVMAETVGNSAVQSLREGRKPVILVDNTIHALLEESLKVREGDAPDFRDVLNRILSQMGNVTVMRQGPTMELEANAVTALPNYADTDHDDEDEVAMEAALNGEAQEGLVPALPEAIAVAREAVNLADDFEEVRTTIRTIQMLIERFPPMQASAIDVVKNTLRRAGFTCGEITGRDLEVGVDDKVKARTETDRDRVATKNAFNSGKLDGIIINSAGATGTDLHASERFADQRQREFHVLQAPDKIQKEIQAIGRVSRYGEVIKPRIHFHSSGLPYKVRLDSMRNNKLRFASATISGNRDTMLLMQGIPDLINPVGDQVVWDYAQKRPDLISRLCLTKKFFPANEDNGVKEVEKKIERLTEEKENETEYQKNKREEQQMRVESIRRNSHLANDFLSRLSLLPVDYQEKTLRELGAEYELAIEELNAKGENPLRPRELAGVVHIIGQPVVMQGATEAMAQSAFDGPVHLVNAEIERVADAVSSEQVMSAIDKGSAEYETIRRRTREILQRRDRIIEPYLPSGVASVEEALLQGQKFVANMVSEIHGLAEATDAFVPGREIDFRLPNDDKVKAIIVELAQTPGTTGHLLSSYWVTVAVPGETNFFRYSMKTLLASQPVHHLDKEGKPTGLNVRPGLEGEDYEKILARFDDTTARRRVPAKLLTTNIFHSVRMAAQSRLGQLVSFIDVEGRRHRGVLINRSAEKRLERVSVRLGSKELILHALTQAKVECNSSDYASKNSIIISPQQDGSYYLRLPPVPANAARRGNAKSPAYMALLEQTEEVQPKLNRIKVRDSDHLEEVLDIVMDPTWNGVQGFYVAHKNMGKLNLREFEEQNTMQMAGGMQ
jgi:hypothetical protein